MGTIMTRIIRAAKDKKCSFFSYHFLQGGELLPVHVGLVVVLVMLDL